MRRTPGSRFSLALSALLVAIMSTGCFPTREVTILGSELESAGNRRVLSVVLKNGRSVVFNDSLALGISVEPGQPGRFLTGTEREGGKVQLSVDSIASARAVQEADHDERYAWYAFLIGAIVLGSIVGVLLGASGTPVP
jgi:hypothetical protein